MNHVHRDLNSAANIEQYQSILLNENQGKGAIPDILFWIGSELSLQKLICKLFILDKEISYCAFYHFTGFNSYGCQLFNHIQNVIAHCLFITHGLIQCLHSTLQGVCLNVSRQMIFLNLYLNFNCCNTAALYCKLFKEKFIHVQSYSLLAQLQKKYLSNSSEV